MAKFVVRYSHNKPGSHSSSCSYEIVVEAESEATAIRIVEDKHPGEDVSIKSVKRRD
jgi:hypothetical protein